MGAGAPPWTTRTPSGVLRLCCDSVTATSGKSNRRLRHPLTSNSPLSNRIWWASANSARIVLHVEAERRRRKTRTNHSPKEKTMALNKIVPVKKHKKDEDKKVTKKATKKERRRPIGG